MWTESKYFQKERVTCKVPRAILRITSQSVYKLAGHNRPTDQQASECFLETFCVRKLVTVSPLVSHNTHEIATCVLNTQKLMELDVHGVWHHVERSISKRMNS